MFSSSRGYVMLDRGEGFKVGCADAIGILVGRYGLGHSGLGRGFSGEWTDRDYQLISLAIMWLVIRKPGGSELSKLNSFKLSRLMSRHLGVYIHGGAVIVALYMLGYTFKSNGLVADQIKKPKPSIIAEERFEFLGY